MKERKRTNKKYSPEFKISVILDMREKHLGYRETVRKHWRTSCRSEEDLYVSTLKKWERIYLTEGQKGFMEEKRGRNSKGRPRKKLLDKQSEEDLIAENQRLRMEIEYLKKLSALVLAEEQKNGKRRS